MNKARLCRVKAADAETVARIHHQVWDECDAKIAKPVAPATLPRAFASQ